MIAGERTNRKIVVIVLLGVLIVAGIAFLGIYLIKNRDDSKEQEHIELLEDQDLFENANRTYDISLKAHSTADDCWIAHNGIVYDISTILASLNDVTVDNCGGIIETEISSDTLSLIAPYEVSKLN